MLPLHDIRARARLRRNARWATVGLGAAVLAFAALNPRSRVLAAVDAAGASSGTATSPAPSPLPAGLVPLTNMLRVLPGSFVRLNQHVTLTREYWLGKYEVTQAEYLAVTGKNPSHFTADPRLPVEKVSEVDAAAYCAQLTRREREAGRLPANFAYRLPTEAEWEYACRAGTTNRFSFGDDVSKADAYAWTEENSEAKTHVVGQKLPNPWGFHDMHGNVWEWCRDWFTNYPPNAVTDPAGPPGGKFKVFRGGGWNNESKFARSSNRFMMSPANGIHFVGFRLALGEVIGGAPGTPALPGGGR